MHDLDSSMEGVPLGTCRRSYRPWLWSVLLLIAVWSSASAQPVRLSVDRAGFASRALATLSDDGAWIVGRVVDVVSGEPLAEALARSGLVGTLTDELGWFRLQVAGSAPHEIIVEKVGYSTAVLRFVRNDDDRIFYVQNLNLSPCDRVAVSGVVAHPNEVVFRVLDAADGTPVSGRADVSVHQVGGVESVSLALTLERGDLRLPVEQGGVYSIRIVVDGYIGWSTPAFVVPFDPCDVHRMAGVERTIRLARPLPASQQSGG